MKPNTPLERLFNGIVKENRTELHPTDEDDFENITLSNDSGMDEPEIM